MALAKY